MTDGPRVTASGYPEHRGGGDRRAHPPYVTLEEVRAMRRRTWRRNLVAWLLVIVSSSVGIWMAVRANDKTTANAHAAVLRSCLSRAELRMTVAVGFDELRRLALAPPRSRAQRRAQQAFIGRTQAPIDKLLSDAAGRRMRTDPPGPLPAATLDRVRGIALRRCMRQADAFRQDDGGP